MASTAPKAILDGDRRNNVENVHVPVSDPSTWTINVTAVDVAVDAEPSTKALDQPFALVVHPIVDEPTSDGSSDGDSCSCGGGSGGGGELQFYLDRPAFVVS